MIRTQFSFSTYMAVPEGFRLDWTDRLGGQWSLKNEDGIFCSSKTLEGLESNYKTKVRELKKVKFIKERVIVLPSYGGTPWVGNITSRPNEREVWVVREDEQGKKEKINWDPSFGGVVNIMTFTVEAFEKLCDLKELEAHYKKLRMSKLKELTEMVQRWAPDDNKHPVTA